MISKIRLSNFKSLVSATINFSRITVLAGANSVGKSTTIQSILLLRSIIETIKARNLQERSETINVPLNGPYMLSLGNAKEVISWEQGKFFEIEIFGETNNSLNISFESKTLDESNFFVNAKFPSLVNSNFNIVHQDLYYLNAERLGPRIRHWVNESADFSHCGYQGQYTIDVLARLGNDADFTLDEKKFLKGVEAVGMQSLSRHTQQWMDFIIPGTHVDKAEILGKLRSTSIKFNSFFSPPNVGFGISYILPIVVSGLIAKINSTIIVENPEAHLHPKGQSNLGFFLAVVASAGIQVIVETHSEHVINGMRIACIENDNLSTDDLRINFFSKNENDTVDIKEINVTTNGDLTDFPVDFFDQARQDLLKIFKLSNKKRNG